MTSPELKEFVEELRTEWKDLWRSRVEDKVRAEGIAKNDYSTLFVERGTVIMATRDYKPMEFFDIVQQYLHSDADKAVPINSTIGGWGKFVKDNIKKQKRPTKRTYTPPKPKHDKKQQQKKGGRGWRHTKLLNI